MRVTVQDCLKLDSFRRSMAVSGEKRQGNRVRSVSVMDAATPEEAVKCNGTPDSMILTTFAGMKTDIKLQCETITALARSGVATIVIFQRDSDSHSIDKRLIETAEEAGLPLIVMVDGESLDYSNAISEVMENILYGNSFTNSLISNTIFHLLNFEKYANFQEALREAAVSNDFQVCLLADDFTPIYSVETRHQTTMEEMIRRGREIALGLSNIYNLIEIDGILSYWGLMNMEKEKYFLCIVDNEDNYSSGEMTKLAEIIQLAVGMWKYTPERDIKGEFIRALLRGNRSLAYSLKSEIGIRERDIVSVFSAKGIDNTACDEVIKSYVDRGILTTIIIEEEYSYGMLLKGPKFEESDEPRENGVCIELYNRLKEFPNVKILHYTGVGSIEWAGDGFRLVGESYNCIENVFPYKRVLSKYEMTLVSNCIKIQMEGGQLRKNFVDLIAPFRREGDNKAKQLLETLETFILDAGTNSNKTAEFMGIHTNTVQYRLKKINDMLGAELTGNRVIPGLTIALALHRMEMSNK